MSTQANQQAAIRDARHAGFINATNHLDDQRRSKLAKSYSAQDARRERNITKFVKNLKGA
jgi:hypothetical protein